MRLTSFVHHGTPGLAIRTGDSLLGITADKPDYPGTLGTLLNSGAKALEAAASVLRRAPPLNESELQFTPLLQQPPKIICVGLNYAEHARETSFEQPDYPAFFPRYASSLIGHGAPIVRPLVSRQLDYEGELAVIIGRGGRHIGKAQALDYVAGYSIFNDASVRDYQFKSSQWTVGKNFDASGAFGPDFVSADELPDGGKGLRLDTRLNGRTVQSGNTADLIFDVAELIMTISAAMTLEPGDVIVSGTPSGVGFTRKPPLFMKHGDVCEVEIEGLGILRNPVTDEGTTTA